MPTTIRTIKEAAVDRLNECSEAVASRFLPAVRTVFSSTRNGTPLAIGTCFLLRIRAHSFLVTAAHVIDNSQYGSLLVAGDENLELVEGDFYATTKPDGDRSKDKFDFAFLELSEDFVNRLGSVKYIEESELSRNRGSAFGRVYLAMGYPVSRNKKVNVIEKSVPARAWTYSSIAPAMPELATEWGVTGDDHIFLKHDAKYSLDTSGARIHSIQPKGASGGVLIDLGLVSAPQNLSPEAECTGYLAGVLIENPKKHSAIVAVKIGLLVEQLAKHIECRSHC